MGYLAVTSISGTPGSFFKSSIEAGGTTNTVITERGRERQREREEGGRRQVTKNQVLGAMAFHGILKYPAPKIVQHSYSFQSKGITKHSAGSWKLGAVSTSGTYLPWSVTAKTGTKPALS